MRKSIGGQVEDIPDENRTFISGKLSMNLKLIFYLLRVQITSQTVTEAEEQFCCYTTVQNALIVDDILSYLAM